jgi:hypothetical protein
MTTDPSGTRPYERSQESRLARLAIALSGIAAVVVATLLYVGWQPVVELLPFVPSTTLTNQFLGSVAFAYAAAALWIAWSDELAAFAGAGLTIIVVSIGAAVGHISASGLGTVDVAVALGGVAAGVITGAAVRFTTRLPFRDRRPTPRYVRAAFVVYVIVLVGAGLPIALAVPNVLPWHLGSNGQAMVGWIFLADALYFGYGAIRPRWGNAVGQLLAFLAYDVALIVPILVHVGNVDPAQTMSLIGYIGVLVVSGAIAIYAFTLDGRTRIGSRDTVPSPEVTTASPGA